MVALNQCRCRRSVTDSCRGSFAKRAPRAHHRGLLPLLLVALTATPALAIGKNQGSWGPKIDLPVIPVAAAVTINNKLLMWSAELKDGYASANGTTQTATLDLDTMEVSEAIVSNTGHNMFCPGLAYLFSGTLLVNGGANDYQTSLYDPSSATWSAGAQMNIPRGYPGDCTLSDNRVFTIGGSWSGGTAIKNGEIWSNKTGWRKLTGALVDVMLTDDPEGQFRQDNQPWLFALGRNIVFQAGPSKQMNFFDMSGEGSSRPAGLRGDDGHAMNGFAVMYEPYKILTTGGGPAYSYDDIPATNNAHVITLDEFNVKSVEKVESMKYARAFHNAIILPDGDVLVVGGQSVPRIFADSNAVLVPELWDHKTRTFRTLESDYIPRTYHSTGILLPDGRVFSGGGGLCNPSVQNYCPKYPDGSSATGNHLDGRIFTPPYLLKEDGSPAERPAIVDAPRAALHSAIITVKTDGPVKSFVLIRLGAVTHTMNNDQRRIPLEFAPQGDNTYTMKIPSSRGLVISGYYWLFALNADGVPSVAHRIRIEQRDS